MSPGAFSGNPKVENKKKKFVAVDQLFWKVKSNLENAVFEIEKCSTVQICLKDNVIAQILY